MEIFDKVMAILAELSGVESLSLEHELRRDLGLDSLQMVMLLMMLEDHFQIVLHETDMNPFDLIHVGQVVKLMEKYVVGEKNDNLESKN